MTPINTVQSIRDDKLRAMKESSDDIWGRFFMIGSCKMLRTLKQNNKEQSKK